MRSALKILTVGAENEAVLRQVALDVENFDSNLNSLIKNMIHTMHLAKGIGIAAPQVGERLAVCIADVFTCVSAAEHCLLDDEKTGIKKISPLVLINPKVVFSSEQTVVFEEGCLSVPGVHGKVKRPNSIEVKFFDESRKAHVIKCSGLLAICLQHEIDHLNGVLFIDKLAKE